MATKKASARRPVTPKRTSSRSTPKASVGDRISGGLNKLSVMKTFANYGFSGLAVGWLLVYTLPEAQNSFTESIQKQVEHSDKQRSLAIEHGERAVDKISSAVDRLGEKFQAVQGTTQGKQDIIIDRQERMIDGIETTNKLLSGQLHADPVTKIGIHPMPFSKKNDQSSGSQ